MEKKARRSRGKEVHSIMLRLDSELYQALQEESKRKHLPLATLVKLWVVEKLEEIKAKRNA